MSGAVPGCPFVGGGGEGARRRAMPNLESTNLWRGCSTPKMHVKTHKIGSLWRGEVGVRECTH